MRKWALIAKICVLSLAVGLFGGCSRNAVFSQQEAAGPITKITFFGNKYEPENVTVIDEIITAFMKENPTISVSYESLKGTEYYDVLKKRMAAGKGDDVFMVNHDSALEFAAAGQLEDLSGLNTLSLYTTEMQEQMREPGGAVYWLPTTMSAFGLYCNMDLLKKHQQKVPENWEEWQAACDYFAANGITPIIANNDISFKTVAIGSGLYPLYRENKQKDAFQKLNNGQEKLSRYLESGFSMVKSFIDKGYVDAEAALKTNKTSDDLTEFVKGESPFMLTGGWATGRVKNMNPGFEFEVVPYPLYSGGAVLVINADTRLSVNAGSAHKEETIKFLEYFTHAENIQKFADQQSSFSPLEGGAPSSTKEIQPLIDCYQSGRIVIGSDSLLNIPIWDITAQVSKKLLSGDSMEATMAWMDEEGRVIE